MKLLILLLFITSVTADKLNVCFANHDQTRFAQLKNQMKQVEQTINNLETGLKGKKVNVGCSDGWQLYRGHCYYFSTDVQTWFKAERVCRSKNSFLVKINDIGESNWVYSKTRGSKFRRMWIGGNDCDQDEWIWSSDFTPMKFTNWDRNQPGKTTVENCAVMETNGKWHDYSCKTTLKYICKKHSGC